MTLRFGATLVFCLFVYLPVTNAHEAEENKVKAATEVLSRILQIPEQAVPPSLLRRAHAVAVIPGVIKVGVGVGGRRGKGILVVRDENNAWSQPSFITLTGGSFGWQIGAQSTDIILVFKSKKGVEGITKGKLTLGGDASVAAGPVGRHAAAATDLRLRAEVYSYSRSRGIFAGVSLDGSALRIDRKANGHYYDNVGITAGEVFSGDILTARPGARDFVALLSRSAPVTATAELRDSQAVEVTDDGVRTFALEDPDG